MSKNICRNNDSHCAKWYTLCVCVCEETIRTSFGYWHEKASNGEKKRMFCRCKWINHINPFLYDSKPTFNTTIIAFDLRVSKCIHMIIMGMLLQEIFYGKLTVHTRTVHAIHIECVYIMVSEQIGLNICGVIHWKSFIRTVFLRFVFQVGFLFGECLVDWTCNRCRIMQPNSSNTFHFVGIIKLPCHGMICARVRSDAWFATNI